jgi:hypothetical protein
MMLQICQKNDVLIFWGGTNNVSKNNSSNGLKYITQFVKNNYHTNIIRITVPHCYDLPAFSCVNNEVKVFHKKLMKYMKPNNHNLILEMDPNTEYFTNHGLHLNGPGKEVICNKIVSSIEKILHFKEDKPTSMYWKTVQVDNTNLNSTDRHSDFSVKEMKCNSDTDCNNKNVNNYEGTMNQTSSISDNSNSHDTSTVAMSTIKRTKILANHRSTRQRKVPATKKDNFLWEIK